MNTYEQKIEAKRERFEALAASNRDKSNAAYARSDMREGASGIPLGQPILVGHHSEGRHRAAIKRADNAMRNSIDLDKKADYYERRAAGVGTGGISSDDPEAIAKLQAKLEELQQLQDFMKRANKIIRPAFKKGITGPDSEGWSAYVAELRQIPHGDKYTDERAAAALVPSWGSHVGFETFQLTNNNAKIKSTKERIAALESKADAETKTETLEGICEIVQNVEENRIQFIFDGKPSADIRAIMKSHGFRWAPSQGAWQRHLNNNGKYSARLVIKQLKDLA